jgi:hypothetical protein
VLITYPTLLVVVSCTLLLRTPGTQAHVAE